MKTCNLTMCQEAHSANLAINLATSEDKKYADYMLIMIPIIKVLSVLIKTITETINICIFFQNNNLNYYYLNCYSNKFAD